MRSTAKRHGKAVPTLEQLENLLSWTNGMVCKDCGRQMNWLRTDGGPSTQITLQHYRSGSMALICLACNTRHAQMPGDSYVDMPKDHKWCPMCQQIKPLSAYGERTCTATGRRIPKSRCRPCNRTANAKFQREKWRRKKTEVQP